MYKQLLPLVPDYLFTRRHVYRAAMSRPSPIYSKFSAPQSQFPSIALTQRDFRLNFCINNGSCSNCDSVPIYTAATLDRQLDEVSG